MPPVNYLFDNRETPEEGSEFPASPEEGAALMGLTPEGMKLFGLKPKPTDLGPSEVLDSTLGEYLHHPDTPAMVNLTPEGEKLFDVVKKPRHYNLGKVECIDAIESALAGMTGFGAYCAGNVIKYTWRHPHKNGAQDLEKARFYLDKLIQITKQEDKNGHPREN